MVRAKSSLTRWAVTLLAISLSGCDRWPTTWTKDEIHTVASDAARDAIIERDNGLNAKHISNEELDRRISELENRNFARTYPTYSAPPAYRADDAQQESDDNN